MLRTGNINKAFHLSTPRGDRDDSRRDWFRSVLSRPRFASPRLPSGIS